MQDETGKSAPDKERLTASNGGGFSDETFELGKRASQNLDISQDKQARQSRSVSTMQGVADMQKERSSIQPNQVHGKQGRSETNLASTKLASPAEPQWAPTRSTSSIPSGRRVVESNLHVVKKKKSSDEHRGSGLRAEHGSVSNTSLKLTISAHNKVNRSPGGSQRSHVLDPGKLKPATRQHQQQQQQQHRGESHKQRKKWKLAARQCTQGKEANELNKIQALRESERHRKLKKAAMLKICLLCVLPFTAITLFLVPTIILMME